MLKKHISDVLLEIETYNQAIDQRAKLKDNAKESVWTSMANWLAPLFLIVGLAVRFVKTSGEIRLERQSAA
jgi:hypothetical protein